MHFFSDQYLSGTQNYFKHVQSQGYNEVNDSRTIEKCGKKITEVVDEFLEENGRRPAMMMMMQRAAAGSWSSSSKNL